MGRIPKGLTRVALNVVRDVRPKARNVQGSQSLRWREQHSDISMRISTSFRRQKSEPRWNVASRAHVASRARGAVDPDPQAAPALHIATKRHKATPTMAAFMRA